MPTPIIPIGSGVAQSVRGLAWNIKQSPQFSTIVQRAASGRRIAIPLWTQPLWKWEFNWEFISDAWPGLYPVIQSGNSPFSDLQVLQGFYLSALGMGNEFLYTPPDSAQTAAALGASPTMQSPDANGVCAVTVNRGGYFEQIQELNGGTITNIQKNGGSAGATTIHLPNTVSGYLGYTITASPAFLTTDVITCDFTYYYRCEFLSDDLEFNEFLYKLWELQSLEFQQIRL